jgi:hypothetical protein
VSFAKKRRRPFETPRSRLRLPRAPLSSLLRSILLAALVAIGAAWALVRHYSHTLPPMRVPAVPTAAPTYDIDAGEMPVPETVEPDAS